MSGYIPAFINVISKSGEIVVADIILSLEQKMDRCMHTCIIHVCRERGSTCLSECNGARYMLSGEWIVVSILMCMQ